MRTPLLALMLPLLLPAQGLEILSTAAHRTHLAVTVYQDGWALVRDRRRVTLPEGLSRLAFADVAGRMKPETALFREFSPTPTLRILERDFEADLLSPVRLAQKSLGGAVGQRWEDRPELTWGTLVSLPTAPLLAPRRTPGEASLWPLKPLHRIARIYPPRRLLHPGDARVLIATGESYSGAAPQGLAYRTLPRDLRPHPTLLQSVEATQGGPRDIELTYLTRDFHWQVRYVASLAADLSTMDLDAFVSVDNQSGAAYLNATLALLAGEVNRVPDPDTERHPDDPPPMDAIMSAVTVEVSAVPVFKRESLLDYHLFSLDRPTTIGDRSQKQLQLFSVQAVPLERRAELNHFLDRASSTDQGTQRQSAEWKVRFRNTAADHLGRPLPQGTVAALLHDPGITLPLPDETYLEALAEGEEGELVLGPARGLSVQRKSSETRLETDGEALRRQLGPALKGLWRAAFTSRTLREVGAELDEPRGHLHRRKEVLELTNETSRRETLHLLLHHDEFTEILRTGAPRRKLSTTLEELVLKLEPGEHRLLHLEIRSPY